MSKLDHEKIVKGIHELATKRLLAILKNGSTEKIPMTDYIKAHSDCTKILSQSMTKPVEYLFNYIREEIQMYLKASYSQLVLLKLDDLIEGLYTEIEKFKILCAWLCKIFMSMEKHRNICLHDNTIPKVALRFFNDLIIIPIKNEIFNAVNKIIVDDRNCKIVERNKIKSILDFFINLDIDDPVIEKIGECFDFKGRLITVKNHNIISSIQADKYSHSKKTLLKEWMIKQYESVSNFTTEKASREVNMMSAPEYINSALKYCEEEDLRKAQYIPSDLHSDLDKINYDNVIKHRLEQLSKMETGLFYMFTHDKQSELKNVYNLYSRLGDTAIKEISINMTNFIKDKVNNVYNNKEIAKDPTKFIPELIKLKYHVDNLVENCFKNNIKLNDSKAKAFTVSMSKDHYSKQLALYCDFMMKVGLKGKNENQIEDELASILNLFKCLSSKIVFQVEYSKKLSERLIQNKTVSIVAEKSLMSKIRADQGVTYTNKMANMFEDLEKSLNNVDSFRKMNHRGNIEGVMLSCQILQQGAWEVDQSKMIKVDLTPKLKKCLKEWEDFYKKNYNTHKLIWVYGLVSFLNINKLGYS